MVREHGPGYEPPSVEDLGTLTEITAGTGGGQRDIAGNDANGKT
jgi:hypothetical protein